MREVAQLCRDGGRESTGIKPFSDYPSVTYGDSYPYKGSQNKLFLHAEASQGRLFLFAFLILHR